MTTATDTEANREDSVYVARQIIIDGNKDIFGYELLFRSANSQTMLITDDLLATTEVLLNTLNSISIQRMIGDKWAFINVNESVLNERVYEALDRHKFVLEILETTTLSPQLIDQIRAMREDGYTFALDDFVFSDEKMDHFKPIFPYISYLKVDLVENDLSSLKEKLEEFKAYDVKFLAEKVETEEDFQFCQEIGFHYYQGYFFYRPEILEGKKIQSNNLALLDLIQAVKTKTDAKEIEDVFKRYPGATVNLLRFINSTSHAFNSKINSVRHAINLIGRKKLMRWLWMMLYVSPRSESSMSTPLLELALQRANMVEQMSILKWGQGGELTEKAFFAGILSLLDVIFQVPMPQLLKDLDVDREIAGAIIYKNGELGQMLKLAEVVEKNDSDAVLKNIAILGLAVEEVLPLISSCYDSL